jgi:peptidoglycan L-alanyl-D-glutamate endopeptidase CwlK
MKIPSERNLAYAAAGLGALAVLYFVLRPKRASAPGTSRSRSLIDKLHPSIQPMAYKLLDAAWEQKIPLVVTQSLRTLEEQQALYDQGRTKPGDIVTKAKPGTSWHNYGLAFDVAVLDENGQPAWPENAKLWKQIGDLGKSVGLAWGGDFVTINDRPHFEHHPGLTLAQAQAGTRPTVA